ncbi:hypothetical protein V493_01846 [Pseudogymnoascus sp. VKM F-4281 (FW-2241)]|nr:hypothetical protein V493_01846 [Pseudogymnoascus sp. VKM F-4281 (FW-2241)]
MPGHRLLSRFEQNIHLVNSENDELGGAYQTGSLTWAEMTQRMDIVFELPTRDFAPFYCLEDGDPKNPIGCHGPPINIQEPNNDIVEPGFYVLLTPDGEPVSVPVNQDMPLPRALSRSPPRSASPLEQSQSEKFCNRVRGRDGRCVITGREADFDFTALDATHIFPVADLELWVAKGWKQQIIDDDVEMSDTGINSIQNGILLDVSAHQFFNKYAIAINPDDDYKVVSFQNNPQYDGLTMFRRPDIPNKYQPCRALLKHHFCMAVLLNMKGRVGYPVWDDDIPPGCDQVAEISNSDQGKLRFETVLAGKLNQFLA